MKNRILTSLFFLLFITIFSSFFGGEYFDFYTQRQEYQDQNQYIKLQVEEFQLQDIRQLEETQFYYTPYKSLINKIIEQIDNAENHIYVEVYIFTEKRIREALVRAKKRGVEVKVIMEKNPYMAYNINNKTSDFFDKNGINYTWSDSQDYALNHSKFILIDELAIISTGNLSYSTFTQNRDFFIFTKDQIIWKTLHEIFEKDFQGEKFNIYSQNLVLSPFYSRDKFNALFSNAQNSIEMYFQYFKDDALIEKLIEQAQKGIQIYAIISKDALKTNKKELRKMKEGGINIQYLEKKKMHSKAILIDKKYLFIGSINFSEYSLDKNREVGILMQNTDIIQKFLELFHSEKTLPINNL